MVENVPEFIPSPNRLTAVFNATRNLTQALRESYWIEGVVVPSGFPTGTVPLDLVDKVTALEYALNPHHIPFGTNGRRSLNVSGWPEPARLATAIIWLSNIHDQLIERWLLHPLCEGKPVKVISGSTPDKNPFPPDLIHAPKDWPQKVDESTVVAIETATSQIGAYLERFEKNQAEHEHPSNSPFQVGHAPAEARSTQSPPPENLVSPNARMIDELQKNPEAFGWGKRRWEKFLGVSATTVTRQPAWDYILEEREAQKAELQSRAHRSGEF